MLISRAQTGHDAGVLGTAGPPQTPPKRSKYALWAAFKLVNSGLLAPAGHDKYEKGFCNTLVAHMLRFCTT